MNNEKQSSKAESYTALSRSFDITGNSICRQFVQWLRRMTGMMGNFDTGPGLRNLIIMMVLHYLGKPLFLLRTWWHAQFNLKAKLRRLLGR